MGGLVPLRWPRQRRVAGRRRLVARFLALPLGEEELAWRQAKELARRELAKELARRRERAEKRKTRS